MNTLSPLPRRTSPRRGFSLVEVVLAVGIMALGVVTILGLLPHGLELSRQTANEQAETRIIDKLVGEMQSMNWGDLDDVDSQKRYFDDQGLEMKSASGSDDENSLLTYVVEVSVPKADVRLPTSVANGGVASKHLRRVIIRMIAAPIPNFNFDNEKSPLPIKIFTQLIANTSPSAI